MSDFINTLVRKNSLRKQCQAISSDDIEKVIADLNDILEERKIEESLYAEQQKAKIEAVERIRQTMLEAGIALDDLAGVVATPSRKRKEVKAKYQITDAQGNVQTWTGRGRTPSVFAQYMASHNITKDQLPSAD